MCVLIVHLIVYVSSGNTVEEQRAYTTLGRSYFILSLAEIDKGQDATDYLSKAETYHLESLNVCNRYEVLLALILIDDDILNAILSSKAD